MQIVDLTQPLVDAMPVWPGDPEVRITDHATIGKQGHRVTAVSFGSHSATHIDGPAHLIDGGKRIDEYPVDRFFARCHVLPKGAQPSVRTEDVGPIPQGCNGVLLAGDDTFLSVGAAHMLLGQGIRLFGFSSPSCDCPESAQLPVHHLLLGHEAVLIENLTNLDLLVGKVVELMAFPMLITGSDSAPARVIAQFYP